MTTALEGPHAAERVARTITIVAGIATVVFLALSLGPMIVSSAYLDTVYMIASPAIVFGTPLILAILARFLTLRQIKRGMGVYAIFFTVVVVAWIPAQTVVPLPDGLAPWPLEITALGTVPAAIAWRPSIAWVYLVINSVLVAPVRFYADGGADIVVPLQFAFFTLTFSAIFTALALIAMKNGYTLDTATARARDAAASAAASAARAQEQARLDALVHDEVISTLYYASQGDEQLTQSVRTQASKALALLEALRGGRAESSEAVTTIDFVARIRSVALDASPAITVAVTGQRTRPVPADVAAAFAEATSEAARNSLEHAEVPGREVRRSTTLALSETGVRVTVRDDGAGFDQRDVSSHRLGILVSIRGRLATLPGGSATVQSRPGEGTLVTLTWSDE